MSEVMTEFITDVTAESLEKELERVKDLKARREAAQRLWRNPDFRFVIIEGFMLHDAARYAQESGDPALNKIPGAREDALLLAQASGHLKRYMDAQMMMGATADRNIADLEEALAEVRAEEGAE